jgi:hypothetical protein
MILTAQSAHRTMWKINRQMWKRERFRRERMQGKRNGRLCCPIQSPLELQNVKLIIILVKSRTRKGIPDAMRGIAWKIMS